MTPFFSFADFLSLRQLAGIANLTNSQGYLNKKNNWMAEL